VLGVAEMGWFLAQYLPREQDRTSPRAAPLRASELGSLPPVVIAVAGHDPLRDEGVAYAGRLRAAGVPVMLLQFPSLPHGFLRFTGPVAAAADAAGQIVAAATALMEDSALLQDGMLTRDSALGREAEIGNAEIQGYRTDKGDHHARSRT
jgi:acetyl esterase